MREFWSLLRVAHIISLVGGDDNIGVLNDTLELLIHVLTLDLELKNIWKPQKLLLISDKVIIESISKGPLWSSNFIKQKL